MKIKKKIQIKVKLAHPWLIKKEIIKYLIFSPIQYLQKTNELNYFTIQ
jgi:hypothetical protein